MTMISSLTTTLKLGASAAVLLFSLAAQGQGLPGQNPDPTQMLLAQLKDVKAPEAVSWWPPAFGWWLVAGIILAVIVTGVMIVRERQKKSRYRKIALRELQTIVDDDPQQAAKHIMQLLKRVFFSAYPASRSDIAGLYGTRFIALLGQVCPQSAASPALCQDIINLIYGAPTQGEDAGAKAQAFLVFAKAWIEAHPRASKKTLEKIRSQLQRTSDSSLNDTRPHTLETAHV